MMIYLEKACQGSVPCLVFALQERQEESNDNREAAALGGTGNSHCRLPELSLLSLDCSGIRSRSAATLHSFPVFV